MTLQHMRVTLAVLWVLAVGVAGIAADVVSLSGWTILAGVALIPPVVLLKFWNRPPKTLSESIQEALR